MTWRIAAVTLWLQVLGPLAMAAQGVTLTPSAGTSVVFDDNVFQRPVAESDLSVRFSPRLDVARRSDKLTFSGQFAMNADRFSEHPELTTALAREDVVLDARYAASPRLSIATAASFMGTEMPEELNEIAALTPGRARAQRVTVQPSATYSLGPRADASVAYSATSDTLRGGVSVMTHAATSSLERHVSDRSTLRVEYLEQHFIFSAGPTSASRAITTTWSHNVTRGTTLTLRGGPRVTRGVVAPELSATARHVERAGSVTVSYQQTQTTLIGLSGVADVRGVTVTAERALRSHVRLTASSGASQTRQPEGSSLAYRVSGGCTWTLANGLAVEAAYDADRQRGNLYTALPDQNIGRNRVMLTLIVARPPGPESAR
jgi:hypothetical protein